MSHMCRRLAARQKISAEEDSLFCICILQTWFLVVVSYVDEDCSAMVNFSEFLLPDAGEGNRIVDKKGNFSMRMKMTRAVGAEDTDCDRKYFVNYKVSS